MSYKIGYRVTDYVIGRNDAFIYGMRIVYIIAAVICMIGAILTAGFWATQKFLTPESTTIQIENIPQIADPQPKDTAPHPYSLPALMTKDFQGEKLTLGEVLKKEDAYTKYYITYRSEGFKISGVLNVPKGSGPFPVIVSNHGFIEPVYYRNGQGLKREEDFFARHGYVVLHSDYRNYASSDSDPENDIKPRTGYTEDVANAILAVKNSGLPYIDTEKIFMLGHSMGGGIALNVMVVRPDLVKAYVLLAPINADYKKNFDRWVAPEMSDIAKDTIAKFGSYEENPELWESFSAKNYFENIAAPIMLHQGTQDKDVPLAWSQELYESLKRADKEITYFEYPGEGHTFYAAQDQVMQRSLEFFDRYAK